MAVENSRYDWEDSADFHKILLRSPLFCRESVDHGVAVGFAGAQHG
jgi:hypothetical protein